MPTELELLKYLAPLGVGGVLAGFIFWFYRKDSEAHAKAWQGQSELLVTVVRDNTAAVTSLQTTTVALQETMQSLQLEMARREAIPCPYGHAGVPVPRHERRS